MSEGIVKMSFPKTTFVELSLLLDKLLQLGSVSGVNIKQAKASYIRKFRTVRVMCLPSYRNGSALEARYW